MADIDDAAVQQAERRIAAAHSAGLSTSAAARLRGETKEELEADATHMAAELAAVDPNNYRNEDGAFDPDAYLRAQVGR